MPSLDLPDFSDYLVFVDESGDHGLDSISDDFPVFVLLFVIVSKADYAGAICREVQQLKLRYWGHDEVVLHEHEIRKPKDEFAFLLNAQLRQRFTAELTALMAALPTTLVAVVIDKPSLLRRYHRPVSPYDYAMEAGLERVYRHLESLGQQNKETPVIVECRGRREDAALELVFRRICDGANTLQKPLPFRHVLVPKTANSVGLQLADLMARPVGLHHFRPAQPNRAYDIIATKFRRGPAGQIAGYGLKVLP